MFPSPCAQEIMRHPQSISMKSAMPAHPFGLPEESFTVATLCSSAPLLPADMHCGEVFHQFIAQPQVSGFAIADQEGRFGLVDRASFIALFAMPYHPELYGHKPIRHLMERDPLCVECSTSIHELGAVIMADYPRALHTGFIITRNGQYVGLGRGIDLLQIMLRQMENTLDQLRRSQIELVRREKMAALGSLVAGVAHELNTPLGNALSLSSTLEERSREFKAKLESGLRRSTLDQYVTEVQPITQGITRNLTRAAELITSFKHVAVDQSSSNRRHFDLAKVIKEVADTLYHTLKKSPHTLIFDIPEDIVMDSYPGPLGQVMTNLINNALIHAFAENDQGRILCQAQSTQDGHVVLTFGDNGRGINPEHLNRIFDPFFTTRLGQGGSGLGLHIVYNIVEDLLGGSIQVESVLGQGTRFVMELPQKAPRPKTKLDTFMELS
ncbi:histidine kinase [Gammaproteobacteria bacterium]